MAVNQHFTGSLDSAVDESRTYLIHGTSVEAVLVLLRTGKLRREAYHVPAAHDEGSLYFVPNPEKYASDPAVSISRSEYEENWLDCLGLSHSYATANGTIHHVLYQTRQYDEFVFELPFNPEADFDIGKLATWKLALFENWAARLSQNGISRDRLMAILNQANKRRGVLLCCGQPIQELGHEYDEEDYGFKIFLPDGLDAKYITQIVPQGDIERRLLLEEIAAQEGSNGACPCER